MGQISERLRLIRDELQGDLGDTTMAHFLNIPARAWRHHEAGVAIPGEVLLMFLERAHPGLCRSERAVIHRDTRNRTACQRGPHRGGSRGGPAAGHGEGEAR